MAGPSNRSERGPQHVNRWTWALVIALAAGIGIALATALGLGSPHAARVTGDFTDLVYTSGETLTRSNSASTIKLVAYGYTSCADACPATLTKMHGVLEALGVEGERISPLFVTLNPDHDTNAILEAYVHHFDPRIQGLTGERSKLQHSAEQLNALPVDPVAKATPDGGPNHAVRLYLLSAHNELLRAYELEDSTRLIAADIHRRLAPRS